VSKPDERELFLLDGANELSGLRALIWVIRRWPDLRRELTSTPGYVAHRFWYGFPYTFGLVTWWESEAAAYRFAHRPVHLEFWSWATDARHTRGGWLAHYRYVRGGALWGNGVTAMMRRLSTFSPPAGQPPRRPPAKR